MFCGEQFNYKKAGATLQTPVGQRVVSTTKNLLRRVATEKPAERINFKVQVIVFISLNGSCGGQPHLLFKFCLFSLPFLLPICRATYVPLHFLQHSVLHAPTTACAHTAKFTKEYFMPYLSVQLCLQRPHFLHLGACSFLS